jgi:hypothetical protein
MEIPGVKALDNLLERLLGPAADEAGEALRAQVVNYRQRRDAMRHARQLEIAKSASVKLLRLGVRPALGSGDGFFQILEVGGDSSDETLGDMFAELLATELTPGRAAHPSYAKVLSQLAPLDAKILRRLRGLDRDYSKGIYREHLFPTVDILLEFFGNDLTPEARQDVHVAAENLIRLGLCAEGLRMAGAESGPEYLRLTDYGVLFVEACSGPSERDQVK